MISALAAAALAVTVQTDVPRLDAASTLAIIEGCKVYAEENELAVAIAVLDDRLKMAGFLRMDGVRQGPADLAVKKAEYVANWGHETKVLADAVSDGRLGWAMTTGGPSVEGGVPVYSDGMLLGSVGVSGAPAVEDAKCARAGIERARLSDSR